MRRPRPVLIDAFCCEGGAGKGYHRAGFDVIGVDISPQPRYPLEFVQADAVAFLWGLVASGGRLPCGTKVAAVHASPPCQARSDLRHRTGREYPELIEPVQEALDALGLPFVIENVEGAHELRDPVRLCGANDDAFPELRVIRHRLFETNWLAAGVACPAQHPLVFTHDKRKAHYGKLDQDTSYVQVTGGGNCTIANKRAAMGTPWMSGRGCNEAIPPAYAEFIGRQLMEVVR